MHIQRALEQLGYPHNEITVYLALLKMGEGTITDIGREAGLPRTTTQLVVSDLQKKGLVSLCQKRQHQLYLAENPSRFLSELHAKEALMKKLLPDLQAIQHETKNKPVLKYYNGRANVLSLIDLVKQNQYPLKIIGSVEEMSKQLGDEAVEEFFNDIFSTNVPIQLISNNSEFIERLRVQGAAGRGRIRISEDEKLQHIVYFVFNSQVAIILLNSVGLVGVLFDDVGMAESSTLFFERVWNSL